MSKVDEHKFLDEQAMQILLLRLHARFFSIRKIYNVHDIREKVLVKKSMGTARLNINKITFVGK